MAGLSKAGVDRGWNVLEPADWLYGSDLRSRVERETRLRNIIVEQPELVSLEPPCGPWSTLQHLVIANPGNSYTYEDLEELRSKHHVFWQFARKVWRIVTQYGGLCLIENPWSAESWSLEEMSSLENKYDVLIDQCTTGLRDPASGKLCQKRTKLRVNSQVFADLLSGHVCNHSPDEHEQIQGAVRTSNGTFSRSAYASV